MTWINPLNIKLIPTNDSESFKIFGINETGIPFGNHPGAFGFKRKNHTHEGIDLYCNEGDIVYPVEPGIVTAIEWFTGELAVPPSPWWLDTMSIIVEGASGAVLYGEVVPLWGLNVGDTVEPGTSIAVVARVLKKDKGRPMTMLHLELHKPGTTVAKEWVNERPDTLLDPTEYLMKAKNW